MLENSPQLESNELQRQIIKNLSQYSGRSSFECFALILGKAQILEFGLKNLLAREFFVSEDDMEKWTLGKVTSELEKKKIRGDYISYLKEFVKERNYIAHEMLVNNAIYRSMAANISERFEFRQLQTPAFNLERLLIVYDWLEEHGAWRC